ncbi:hypothetical protein F5B19DRAFT_504581 [Rostrohypoxylon terebratum]|nr:hypothetical protein F5B19DRAFT_504581 [Rostrohypoxylon terebratum]
MKVMLRTTSYFPIIASNLRALNDWHKIICIIRILSRSIAINVNMDSHIKRALNDLSATTHRSRIPLSNRSNVKTRTRQRSPESLWDRKDSSESQPSPHNSIYDAAWASESGDVVRSPYQTPDPALVPMTPTKTKRPMTPASQSSLIDLNADSPLSRLEQTASTSTFDTQFLYGHGTELAPIAEQRSIATLRTMATKSSIAGSNMSPLLKHQPSGLSNNSSLTRHENSISSAQNTPPRRALRRRISISLDDISPSPAASTPRRTSNGSRRISGEASEPGVSSAVDGPNPPSLGVRIPRLRMVGKQHSPPSISTVDGANIHAYPQKPLYPPHQAPATPVAYAEWLTANRGRVSHHYPGAHPSTVFIEQPFRGLRSGHGNLETHPFVRGTGMSGVRRPAPGPRSATFEGLLGAGRVDGDVSSVRGVRGLRVRGDNVETCLGGQCCDVHMPQEPSELWVCKACGRPADQRWSLLSTLIGSGAGARRGDEWCSRCCWRKMVYLWCFCEPLGDSDGT